MMTYEEAEAYMRLLNSLPGDIVERLRTHASHLFDHTWLILGPLPPLKTDEAIQLSDLAARHEALRWRMRETLRTSFIRPIWPATKGETSMCSQRDDESPPAQTEAMRPSRSKFRPFMASRPEHTPWNDGKDTAIENVKLRAQAIADALEREYVRVPPDARRTYEYELARTALEDCVMRATRMITS